MVGGALFHNIWSESAIMSAWYETNLEEDDHESVSLVRMPDLDCDYGVINYGGQKAPSFDVEG